MNKIILALGVACTATVSLSAKVPELAKQWETEKALPTCESVLFAPQDKVLYVSNIKGKEPWSKDGKGSIARVGLDGKILQADWVTGLHAPKGMGLHQGRLYVTDIDVVAVIDVAKAAIVDRIPIEGAQMLNDITIDRGGAVYVSDSKTGIVHVLQNGKSSVFIKDLKGPNGVLAHGETFYVLADSTLFRVEKDKSLTKLVDGLEGIADGIEHVAGDTFIVSCWQGSVYWVDIAKREKHRLLSATQDGPQSADIGLDPQNRILYVPTFFRDTVVAYELK